MKYRIILKFAQYATVIVDAQNEKDATETAKGLAMMQDQRIDWHPEIDPGEMIFDEVFDVDPLEFEE